MKVLGKGKDEKLFTPIFLSESYMFIDSKGNTHSSSLRMAWVTVIWIVLSCLFGWILSLFMGIPDAIWLIYLEYVDFIYYYDLFCLSMIASFALMPIALIFSWKPLYQNIKILSPVSKSKAFVFSLLTPIALLPSIGFLFLSDDKGALFHIFLNLLTFLFDWIGGVIFNISCFLVFFWLLVLTVRFIKEPKNRRSYDYYDY